MGEKREGECGRAEPVNFWEKWLCPFWFRREIQGNPPAPWFGGDEPGAVDELILMMHDKRREMDPEHNEKFKDDNLTIQRMRTAHRWQRKHLWPVFTDFQRCEYAPGYDSMKYSWYLNRQYQHCVGQLGEDHPTCQKAMWYKAVGTPPTAASWYEEVEELGHYDSIRKWGLKDSVSFLPLYQPVKKNTPGAYEFFRSKQYLEKYDPEGQGEWSYPFVYIE